MKCPQCGFECPLEFDFCPNCAKLVQMSCAGCGFRAPAAFAFCPMCATALSAAAEGPILPALDEAIQRLVPREYAQRLLASRRQMVGERRMVTILMSDVQGSSAMARGMDPEEVMEIMDGAFEVLIEPVYRFEGTVARLEGDAIMAFFGAPIAHEDDPERACRAGLDIVEGARAYAARLKEERGIEGFKVRVGIHTGLVVVGEVGTDLRMEYTAMGEAPNLAARLESAAEPGTVFISEETYQLIAPLFDTQPLAPVEAKGWEQPLTVYRVLSAKELPGKVRGIPGLESPLVGRQAEFAALAEALERLQAGVGGIVTLVGEAGIGKSRLVAELRKRGATQGGAGSAGRLGAASQRGWWEGRCLSYGTSIPYLPWIDVLRSALGVKIGQSAETVAAKLASWVAGLCPEAVDELHPYLATLLSLPLEQKHNDKLDQLDGQQLRERTFAALHRVLRLSTGQEPLVLVLEDLHWADSTSLALLEHVLPLIDRSPLLVVAILRPHKEHGSWRLREIAAEEFSHRHLDLPLDPLTSSDSEALVANLLRVEGLPAELRERILHRAEGNPFYVEEVIRSLIDGGAIVQDEATGCWTPTREVADIPIPDTLHGVLTARIDRLQEDTRRVLHMASVIGRIFLYRVLVAITEEERRLDTQLFTLQREEMIRERARIPELEYIFKHELTREAAYNGLLKRERRAFHRRVAEALERLFPDRIDERLGLLAHHWEHAGDAERATEYLLRAGDQARLAYAHQEAIDYYQRAQALLEDVDEGVVQRQLAIEEGLGDVRTVLAEHDVALAHYERARTLAAATPVSSERQAGLYRKTAMLYERKGQYEIAFQWLERGLGALGDDTALETARIRLAGAGICSRQGQHRPALEWCESGLEIARRHGGRRDLAHGTYLLATIHGHLGHSAEEIARARESLALYEEIGDPVGQANALNNLGIACKEGGDWEGARSYFERGLELEERLGNAHGKAKLTNNLGNVYLQQGDLDRATGAYHKSLGLWQGTGFPVGVALSWSNLGKVCTERGEWQSAFDHLCRSRDLFQEIRSRHFLPEVYRRMATAYLGLQQADEALRCAEEAVALADELDMELERGIGLRVLGQVYLAVREWKRAEELLTAGLAIVEEQGSRYRTGEALRSLGRLYLAMAGAGDRGAERKAKPALRKAEAVFQELGALRDLAEVRSLRTKVRG